MEPEPTCPCKYCGTATKYTGTRLCNFCWNLRNAIEHHGHMTGLSVVLDVITDGLKRKDEINKLRKALNVVESRLGVAEDADDDAVR